MSSTAIAAKRYFGFSELRKGQEDVISAILSNQDVLVLWATGQGKSLCYQLPALMTGKISLVISPLISLMTDQVSQLNNKIGQMPSLIGDNKRYFPACFLGSGQLDSNIERDAIEKGVYRVIFMTPEKLMSSGFIEKLKRLHNQIGLLAVDESHCCSEWGHDFRPSYLKIGSFRESFPNIPIIALTATAVDRVQQDIIGSLYLRSPFISISSLDRTNLIISVFRKNGIDKDVLSMVDIIKGVSHNTSSSSSIPTSTSQPLGNITTIDSTIVYVSTRNDAESLSLSLRHALQQPNKENFEVRCYHGSLDQSTRDEVHNLFLIGKVKVIVATIAFGMGIDKPDIRTILHYGAPQTMEAYLQQIGRAGRDGLSSRCVMFYSDNDFVNYKSDFYTKDKPAHMLQAIQGSTAYLQGYSNDLTGCRRKAILEYFRQIVPYQQCGQCDNCYKIEQFATDINRDFKYETFVILHILNKLDYRKQGVALTNVMKEVMSFIKDNKNMHTNTTSSSPSVINNNTTTGLYANIIDKIPIIRRKEEILKEFIPLCLQYNFITKDTKSVVTQSGFKNTFEVYSISNIGREILSSNATASVLLPVPLGLRKLEESIKKERQDKLSQLQQEGVDITLISQSQLNNEEQQDEMVKIHLKWSQYLKSLRSRNCQEEAIKMESLLLLIYNWRDSKAEELHMAPVSVIPDHVAKAVAYTKSKNVIDLETAGVRIVGVEDLAEKITNYINEHLVTVSSSILSQTPLKRGSVDGNPIDNEAIPLPCGIWTPVQKWPYSVYKSTKNSLPLWKQYIDRFMNKTQPQSLNQMAMIPCGGKAPIKVGTVIGHLLTSLSFGESLDLQRLHHQAINNSIEYGAPTNYEWQTMKHVIEVLGIDTKNENFMNYETQKLILKEILGEAIVDKDIAGRSSEEQVLVSTWYSKISWFRHLVISGFDMSSSALVSEENKKLKVREV